MSRGPKLWIIKFKLKRRTHKLVTPLLAYRWMARQWLKEQKPDAEVLSIEPHRTMALPK